MKRFTIGISAIALALSGAAIAAEQAQQPDANRIVTRAEAQAQAEKLFDRLDANHDGKLDRADPQARREARLGELFDRMDTNHDGAISKQEFIAAHELGGMGGPEAPGPQGHDHPGWRDHGGHEPGMDHGGMRGGHMGLLMAIIHEADPNHTGTITRQAFVSAALKLFDAADTNHDGKLTPTEREAALAAMRQQMRSDMRKHWQEHMRDHGPGPMGGGDIPPPPPAAQ